MLNERYDGTTIDENKAGLARELARMNLTLNSYTQWYWKTDLLSLANFLFLELIVMLNMRLEFMLKQC